MSYIRRIAHYLWSLPKLYTIPAAIIVVAGVVLGVHYAHKAPAAESAASATPHVQLASVAALSSQAGPLPVTGTVTSKAKASVLAQTSGELVSLSSSIGDRVAAGQVIGQFENSAQRAAVAQAEGGYAAAEASYEKTSGTTAANTSVSSAQAAAGAANARTAAITALQSAYSALDDAVRTKSDPLFNTSGATAPTLQPFTIPDQQLVLDVQNKRAALDATLNEARTTASAASATGADVDASIATMLDDARTTLAFLDELILAINTAVPNQSETAANIAAAQAALGPARTEVVSAMSGLATAKSSYDAAVSSAATAANSASSGSASDIAAAQANLQAAQGTLDAARANLEKTIVRSPISGVIVSLPVHQGDYVSAFSPVVQVSNPGALYIDLYVTASDAKTLTVGGTATIGNSAAGTITFIAPAIDPTNGKVEVKVGITSGESTLTDGEVVSVQLARTSTVSKTKGTELTLPLEALKMTPDGAVVFTIGTTTASSALTARAVTLGTILGDRVIITQGLTPDMQIVTDARGLADGETVIVDAQ